MKRFNPRDMKFRTTTLSYPGSAGKPHPNCFLCDGRGYYWNYGGDAPKHPDGEGRMPGPGSDFMLSCECVFSGWQYLEEPSEAR